MPRERRADLVLGTLRRRLLRGDFRFGEELSPVAIAREMGVSRQPVFDALKSLRAAGFIEIVPQVGSFVIAPTPAEVLDTFGVFAALESLSARLASERHVGGQPDALRRALRALASGPERDVVTRQHLNRQFHGLIHAMGGSREATRAAQAYWDRSDFFLAATGAVTDQERSATADAEHAELVGAISDRDGRAAAEIAYQHILSFGEHLSHQLSRAVPIR